ncbi:hypothetical protein NP233_g12105 [Leucocoprinus birnbaumii]|uniref:SAC domain-containing protein n=1 Tax=Leucocoprinus birnbaumii TaxID=56174 RepID=A0AAD5VHN7_9AGAR|nr:hypothetical protein NP233_g12105 [Leucocoprinus birnbaumii]
MDIEPKTPIPSTAHRSGKPLYGIAGIISLSLSEYIIVITGRELSGRLMDHDIYRATSFDILPVNPNISSHNPPHPVETHLLALWDLTRRLQAQWETREKDGQKAFWETADDRFFWNRYLQSRFIDLTSSQQDFSPYILPIMYGTFDLRPTLLHGRHMHLCLISRRSRFRAGTRYFRRGIDKDGHVANFNETEQIVLLESPTPGGLQDTNVVAKLSFVQIRGSVPVFWAEVNTLRYKPDLQIMDLQETADVMRRHLQEQVDTYGDQALVNLVNQKGHEKPVKEAYERFIAQLNLPNVHYEYFDFHNECSKMRWDRISLLIDRIKEDLERHGYFHLGTNEEKPIKLQNGTVRTNCMDNLDRTNVVQATIAKWTLNNQLRELGILSDNAGVDDYESFSKDFREMWAEHADAIATAYGGSGALKSDFTRTGKRTRKGLLEDGVKSTMRYIKNNFFDGARQDGFDLVTGQWVARRTPSASLFLITDARPVIIRSMPLVASFSLFMIIAGLTLPRTSDYSLFYYFLLWIWLLGVSVLFMMVHGIEYVSWPRLIPLTETIYYDGPGFRSGKHGMGVNGGKGEVSETKQRGKWAVNGRVEEFSLDDRVLCFVIDWRFGMTFVTLWEERLLDMDRLTMVKGTKRGSPGAEDEKNIFEGVEIGDEEAKQLETIQRETARVELAIEREGQKKLIPIFKKRREVLKAIPKFWPVALMRNEMVSLHLTISADQSALSYLEDVWVEKDPAELRAFKLEFHFKENPYFLNSVLIKEFKYVPPPATADDTPDENGITEAMVDFSWERDITMSAMKIDWKSEDKNLTKLYPREVDDEDEHDIVDAGSFFNFFEKESDPNDIGLTLANEVFPEAIEYFLGNLGGDEDLDSDDEDEDDDDDDAEEIDLEKPRVKKPRV